MRYYRNSIKEASTTMLPSSPQVGHIPLQSLRKCFLCLRGLLQSLLLSDEPEAGLDYHELRQPNSQRCKLLQRKAWSAMLRGMLQGTNTVSSGGSPFQCQRS